MENEPPKVSESVLKFLEKHKALPTKVVKDSFSVSIHNNLEPYYDSLHGKHFPNPEGLRQKGPRTMTITHDGVEKNFKQLNGEWVECK